MIINIRDLATGLLLVFVLFSPAVISQQDSGSEGIEEILVTSEKSLSLMRLEMENAQDQAFAIFNEIYAGTDYEIICKKEYVPYSRKQERSCDSRFVRDRAEEDLEDYMFDLEANGTADDPIGLSGGVSPANRIAVDEHIQEVDEKIDELYFANPEFRNQVDAYESLRLGYENAMEADRERGFWSRLFGSSD